MKIFAFGSSIVSSYWNGAATYYRGCYKYLARLGYDITFAEPDAYDRQQHRDAGDFSWVTSLVYTPRCLNGSSSTDGCDPAGRDLARMLALAAEADIVVKHSGIGCDDAELERRVPELGLLANGPMTFIWDVDAPATIHRMQAAPLSSANPDALALSTHLYDAILTYGGGPLARAGFLQFGARAYYSMYNGLDPETHHPVPPDPTLACDVAFLGNRLPDREARVDELFFRAAALAPNQRFLLGGEGWSDKPMPPNVRYIGHVPTADHNRLNASASLVLNINRASMADFGFSPPTRVFEVAGAATALLCDDWPGLADCFEPAYPEDHRHEPAYLKDRHNQAPHQDHPGSTSALKARDIPAWGEILGQAREGKKSAEDATHRGTGVHEAPIPNTPEIVPEILVVRNAEDVASALHRYSPAQRLAIGAAFHARALADHTYAQRAAQADFAFRECLARRRGQAPAQTQSLATIADWKAGPLTGCDPSGPPS